MSHRCSYRGPDDGERCSRNGVGKPPYCRHHAIKTIAESGNGRARGLFDLFGDDLIEAADRFISQSNNEIVRNLRTRAGDILAGVAGGTGASPNAYAPPHRDQTAAPPPPPPEPDKKEDPREVLGFGPDVQLTKELVKARRREFAKILHSDRGGYDPAMQRINAAADELLRVVP